MTTEKLPTTPTPPDPEHNASATPSAKPRSPLFDLVLGYPRIAGRFALKPETAAFRRFSALNARMLLYLQADLCRLEKKLLQQEKWDSESPVGANHKYAVNYDRLRLSAYDEDPAQWKLVNEIKERLKEYNDFLIQQSHLHKLTPPEDFDLHDFQHFLGNKELMGLWALTGHDSEVWGSAIARDEASIDLVSLQAREKTDVFSKWVAENAVKLLEYGWGRFKKPNKRTGIVGYYDSSVLKITFALTSILASLLPIASITVLVALSPRPMDRALRAQIGSVAAFNVFISLCLTIFTDAKRTDVFAVTAAFTAVQVVFLGTDGDWKSG